MALGASIAALPAIAFDVDARAVGHLDRDLVQLLELVIAGLPLLRGGGFNPML
jgi:hypothetical protein